MESTDIFKLYRFMVIESIAFTHFVTINLLWHESYTSPAVSLAYLLPRSSLRRRLFLWGDTTLKEALEDLTRLVELVRRLGRP